MTIFEWAEQGYQMEWAIYDAESWAAFNQRCKDEKLEGMDFCIAHDALVLDFRAPEGTPDGTHQVYHARSRGRSGWGEGAVVKDGHFVPTPTEAAAFAAVCRSHGLEPSQVESADDSAGIESLFIEGWSWDADKQALQVRAAG